VKLKDKWQDQPSTYFGVLTHGFPNLLMVAGPQSVSGSTNFPRAIEVGVNWVSDLLVHAGRNGVTRLEVKPEAEQDWLDEVVKAHERLLSRRSKGWFTGYNENIAGRAPGRVRYHAYFGGGPKYTGLIEQEAAEGYPHIDMS
jgi:hypothetical protein